MWIWIRAYHFGGVRRLDERDCRSQTTRTASDLKYALGCYALRRQQRYESLCIQLHTAALG